VKLGEWLICQRHQYKKRCNGKPARITQEHIDQLEAIGFEWNPYETQWQSKFELLRNYRDYYGHCQAPRNYEIDGVTLGYWLANQRQEYKKYIEGKPAKISQERINELTAIGVEWCPGKSEKSEEDRLAVDEYPSGRVPTMSRLSSRRPRNTPSSLHSSAITNTECTLVSKNDIKQSIDAAGFQEEESPARSCHLANRKAPLENRVTRSKGSFQITTNTTPTANRRLRKRAAPTVGQVASTVPKRSSPRLNCGKRKRNTPERLVFDQKRNQTTVTNQSSAKATAPNGMISQANTRRSSKRTQAAHNPTVESIATATDKQWDEHYDRLVEFQWNHGHCRVPLDFCVDHDYYLGQWVVVQRLQYNRLVDGRPSSITASQVERLNAIDFVWKMR